MQFVMITLICQSNEKGMIRNKKNSDNCNTFWYYILVSHGYSLWLSLSYFVCCLFDQLEFTDALIYEKYVEIYEILFVVFRRRVAQRMKQNHYLQ